MDSIAILWKECYIKNSIDPWVYCSRWDNANSVFSRGKEDRGGQRRPARTDRAVRRTDGSILANHGKLWDAKLWELRHLRMLRQPGCGERI